MKTIPLTARFKFACDLVESMSVGCANLGPTLDLLARHLAKRRIVVSHVLNDYDACTLGFAASVMISPTQHAMHRRLMRKFDRALSARRRVNRLARRVRPATVYPGISLLGYSMGSLATEAPSWPGFAVVNNGDDELGDGLSVDRFRHQIDRMSLPLMERYVLGDDVRPDN